MTTDDQIFTIRVPVALAQRLKVEADSRVLGCSMLVRLVLENWVAQQDKTDLVPPRPSVESGTQHTNKETDTDG